MTTTPATLEHAESHHPTHDLLRRRWSPRAFSDRPVERAEIRSVLEAARWAPSGGNGQPWRFIVATREDPAEFDRLLGVLNERNRRWAHNVPVLLLAVAKLYDQPGKEKSALYDVGLAVAHLTTQATALGLSVHQMGGFDADRAREVYSIPQGYEPVVAIALGYLGDSATLPDDLREREQAPRTRKPLHEFVYAGAWEKAAPVVSSL